MHFDFFHIVTAFSTAVQKHQQRHCLLLLVIFGQIEQIFHRQRNRSC